MAYTRGRADLCVCFYSRPENVQTQKKSQMCMQQFQAFIFLIFFFKLKRNCGVAWSSTLLRPCKTTLHAVLFFLRKRNNTEKNTQNVENVKPHKIFIYCAIYMKTSLQSHIFIDCSICVPAYVKTCCPIFLIYRNKDWWLISDWICWRSELKWKYVPWQ